MATLEQRIQKLEAVALSVNIDEISDEELSAHISTLPPQSAQWYGAIIKLVGRRPSALPVVVIDPAHHGPMD